MDSLKLASVNIEGDRHLDRVAAFLGREKPDVLCIQELFGVDVPFFEKLAGPGVFTPVMEIVEPNRFFEKTGAWGIGMFARRPLLAPQTHIYKGNPGNLPRFDPEDPNSGNRAVVVAQAYAGCRPVTIATTHFTWSPGGKATALQHSTLDSLLAVLSGYKPLILCGDMNAPRGGKIFARVAREYRDCVPSGIHSSIDPVLHRIKGLDLMVDCLFASDAYQVLGTRLVSGVSDHMAIAATIAHL